LSARQRKCPVIKFHRTPQRFTYQKPGPLPTARADSLAVYRSSSVRCSPDTQRGPLRHKPRASRLERRKKAGHRLRCSSSLTNTKELPFDTSETPFETLLEANAGGAEISQVPGCDIQNLGCHLSRSSVIGARRSVPAVVTSDAVTCSDGFGFVAFRYRTAHASRGR
jgi:hypothetical protein